MQILLTAFAVLAHTIYIGCFMSNIQVCWKNAFSFVFLLLVAVLNCKLEKTPTITCIQDEPKKLSLMIEWDLKWDRNILKQELFVVCLSYPGFEEKIIKLTNNFVTRNAIISRYNK